MNWIKYTAEHSTSLTKSTYANIEQLKKQKACL